MNAALAELGKAESAYAQNDARAGLAAARRAAGMSLNAALVSHPNEAWGRTYMEHLAAIAKDETAPDAVRSAASSLLDVRPPGHSVIGLRSKSGDERVLEAARDVMAHAYALMARASADLRAYANPYPRPFSPKGRREPSDSSAVWIPAQLPSPARGEGPGVRVREASP